MQGAEALNRKFATTSAELGEMGDDGYRHMLGVETTNRWTGEAGVPPDGQFRLITKHGVAPL